MDDHALATCRDIGLVEGACIHDVRAGHCQITTVTASVVIVACEDGQPVVLDGAAELLAAYHNDSIRLGECDG